MPKRQRDYRAEERRRNELARERGFTSRAQQRRRIEKGEISVPRRPSPNPRVNSELAQKFRLGFETRGIERKGSVLPVFGSRISPVQRARDWSDIYARSNAAQYEPENRPDGMSEREYTQAYLDAFVTGEERYVNTRRAGGSEALRYWFVEVKGYLTADEYESRYGAQK